MLILPTDIFKFDPSYIENEEKYKVIKSEILGEDSDDGSGSEEESSDDDEDEGSFMYLLEGCVLNLAISCRDQRGHRGPYRDQSRQPAPCDLSHNHERP